MSCRNSLSPDLIKHPDVKTPDGLVSWLFPPFCLNTGTHRTGAITPAGILLGTSGTSNSSGLLLPGTPLLLLLLLLPTVERKTSSGMDKYRLLLSVLFVTLSWGCMRTIAQLTTNPTTTLPENTTELTTIAADETTTSTPTETTTNITVETTANITAVTTTNITAETTTNITTVAANTTLPATTIPPVSPNETVIPLQDTVNNTACGDSQLCAAEPSKCDPSRDTSCFFLGAKLIDGNNFEFALSGQSDGYVAASVFSNANGKEVTYVCAKSNDKVKFFGTIKENETLTLAPLHVTSVKGKVNGTTIQCTFLATIPDPLDLITRARRATGVTISLSTGSFNTTSETLGTPTAVLRADVVDLAQPNTTVVNTITTTTSPITTLAPTVAVLETVVSNTSCGTEKLCAAKPTSCNPAAGGTCSFLSVKQKSGQIYSFEISGQSTGYIGSLLSIDATWGNGDSAYLCANNNGRVTFITALYDGTQLNRSPLNVTSGSVAGRVDGSTIQCTFESTLPDTNTRAADYAVAVINGTYDIRTGALGIPSILFNTSILNLTDVANSSPGVVPKQQSLLHVLVLSAGVLSLTILTGH
ncbi:putative cell agglutination protein SPAPB2C8.01 [Oryzias melastigma]|uniref:putative cell agglutination protein SPAPB2C8.01 n=1 Tax=Oryzias melastigma TaxID=30732 RepID=UPI00168D989D|nr:putative cell agglutination protein SPAPB2C8.01 [Oryzias melastigma]